jgi:hypothetical protein
MSAFVASVAVGAAVAMSVVSLAGQAQVPEWAANLPDASVAKAFIASQVQEKWDPPTTPWGDPDISGVFTTKDEANTPMERPEQWAGRRMEDISSEELAVDIVGRQQRALETAPFAGGGEPAEGVAIAVPIHWFDNLAAQNARPWFVIDPPEGKIPPLLGTTQNQAPPLDPDARLRGGRRDTYRDRSLGDRCIAWGAWRTPTIYGNSYQIVQTPDYVVIRQEQVHEARIVPLDTASALSPAIRSYLGQARGYWDGNTLVVVTANYHNQMRVRAFGALGRNLLPAGKLRLIERFTRIAPDKVEWSMTFDDSTVWPRPWTFSLPMTEDDGQIIHEYACHEGNYGLANLLSAGRTAEAADAGGTR